MVVCTGTKNVLSMTGNSDIQYNLMKDMYTGCEIVMGNLEITMMEHTKDFSFLKVRFCITGQWGKNCMGLNPDEGMNQPDVWSKKVVYLCL